ncbi:MAG: hypothetical protein LBI62_00255 [Candidatus Accumulibacter sp.]|nr:hypothetical protein [Accumulibacter sp.]
MSKVWEGQTKGFTLVFHDEDLEVFIFGGETKEGYISCKGFSKRRGNPDFFYMFRSVEAAREYTDEYIAKVRASARSSAESNAQAYSDVRRYGIRDPGFLFVRKKDRSENHRRHRGV